MHGLAQDLSSQSSPIYATKTNSASLSHLNFSILDQVIVSEGSNPEHAFQATFELADLADRNGYRRYWIGEHHNTAAYASSCPELLILAIAARTQRLRVGSGGVLLRNHSALHIAETFRTLEVLYPGRIDLGVGRSNGCDEECAQALQPQFLEFDERQFREKLSDLFTYLEQYPSSAHSISAVPTCARLPEMWLLGSSVSSAQQAASLGMRFSFAHFLNPDETGAALNMYKSCFVPSSQVTTPEYNLAVCLMCADTHSQAAKYSLSRLAWLWLVRSDLNSKIPTPENADRICSQLNKRDLENARRGMIVGTPREVHQQLDDLRKTTGVSEFMITTICHNYAARLRSFELIAQLRNSLTA